MTPIELADGEKILWSGQPDPLTATASRSGIALFGVAWLAIAASGVAAAIPRGETVGIVFGVAFIGIGIVMLGAPLLELRRASGTTYCITETRLIIASDHGRSIKSIQLGGINQVERKATRRGITLRIPTILVSDGDGGQTVDYTDLHGLRDGDQAYRLLTRQSRRTAPV